MSLPALDNWQELVERYRKRDFAVPVYLSNSDNTENKFFSGFKSKSLFFKGGTVVGNKFTITVTQPTLARTDPDLAAGLVPLPLKPLPTPRTPPPIPLNALAHFGLGQAPFIPFDS